MKFFRNLLGQEAAEPCYAFGRFSDVYQAEERLIHWERAIEAHDKKNYLASIRHFLTYLTDELEGNVSFEEPSHDKLRFKVYQGSKCIEGFANQDGFFAEAVIARCESLSLGAMRTLLEENYELRYSAYALDSDNRLTMVMHTDHQDGSPYKLYYGLKELATQADKRDDVLVNTFAELSPVFNGNIQHLGEREKRIKLTYFRNSIDRALDIYKQAGVSFEKYPGMLSYIMLSTAFMVDYLLKPEGKTMDHIEKIFATFFHINTLTPQRKNASIYQELMSMSEVTDGALLEELYDTKHTFGRLEAAAHIKLQEVAEQELVHFDWYAQSDLSQYAVYIPRYVCSLLLFGYALPITDHRLLQILARVLENDFFMSLGYNSLVKHDGMVDEKKIMPLLENILKASPFQKVTPKQFSHLLDYQDKAHFGNSYLRAVSKLDYKNFTL